MKFIKTLPPIQHNIQRLVSFWASENTSTCSINDATMHGAVNILTFFTPDAKMEYFIQLLQNTNSPVIWKLNTRETDPSNAENIESQLESFLNKQGFKMKHATTLSEKTKADKISTIPCITEYNQPDPNQDTKLASDENTKSTIPPTLQNEIYKNILSKL